MGLLLTTHMLVKVDTQNTVIYWQTDKYRSTLEYKGFIPCVDRVTCDCICDNYKLIEF